MEGRPTRWTEKHEVRFNELWSDYPPRNGVRSDKGGARKEFLALNPSENLCGKILAAIQARKKTREWRREGGAFIPDLRKYLKHQMWEDDVAPVDSEAATVKPRCSVCNMAKDYHGKNSPAEKAGCNEFMVQA